MRSLSSRSTAQGIYLTERAIRAGLQLNIIAGSLGMAWVAVAMGMPLTMLFEAMGAGGMIFGLLGTIQHLAMIVQIPAALYAERLPQRKHFWGVLALCHRAFWFAPAFLPLFYGQDQKKIVAAVLLAGIGVSAMLAHASAPAWHSWMADLVPEKQRGRFWSVRQSITMAAYLAAMALAGWALDVFPSPHQPNGSFAGFTLVFAAAAVLGCVDIIIHWFVPEPKPATFVGQMPIIQRILAPLRVREFRYLTLAMGMWYLAVGIASSYGQIYMKREFNATYTHLAIWTISAVAGNIVASRLWAYIIDRIGARTFGGIAILAGPLLGAAIWFFICPGETAISIPGIGSYVMPKAIAMLTASALICGGIYSGVNVAHYNLLGSLAPRQGRTMAMAVHWTIIGVLGALGPLLGGLIMDGFPAIAALWRRLTAIGEKDPVAMLPFGVPFDYIHLLVIIHFSICACAAAPLLLRIRQPGNLPVGTALSRLLVLNPLRALSSIYNIYILTSATSVDDRARAARELGEQRTAIAVRDLIDRLDDPAAEVREEAALALGRIGGQEAIDALLQKLQDAHADLAPQIARALRETPDPRSVPTLVNHLHDADREMRAETARTLGVIGDRRAAPSLLEILRESDDERVVTASCEALARLGEIAAIYEMLPRLRAARNPVLRRSLAVAVADLLGHKRGEFYRVIVAEEHYGSAAGDLIDDLCRGIRRTAADSFAAQGQALVGRAYDLLNAYEERRARRCADLMFELAIGLAALKHGVRFGGNAEVLIEDLIFRDERFAVGVWYLHLLSGKMSAAEDAPSGEMLEVLLGIYFLASHASEN